MNGGGTGSPLLGIHFWVNYDWMWSCLDLVGYTQNSIYALVVWHRLQQRKLILAKNETHKKQKHNQTTESPKTTRQDSPEKNTPKSKNTSHKNNLDKFWLFCVFLVCLFLCACFVFFKPLYSLGCSAQKPGIQKGSKQSRYSTFLAREEKKSQKCMKGRGDRPTPP